MGRLDSGNTPEIFTDSTLYYGDELALAGGSDPDNRRVMPALASLSPARLDVLEPLPCRPSGLLLGKSTMLRSGISSIGGPSSASRMPIKSKGW